MILFCHLQSLFDVLALLNSSGIWILISFQHGQWQGNGVRVDYDEEMGPMHGMYGKLDADLEWRFSAPSRELN